MLKSELVSRLRAATELVTTEVLFIDDRVGDTPHNIRARFLRSGLIVQIYTSLEAHLRQRYLEFCTDLSGCGVSYADFDDSLKSFFTVKAVGGLAGLLRRTASDDRLTVSEGQIGSLGLHVSTPPKYSPLGFGYENSNLNADDVAAFIKSLGYKEPWSLMNGICSSVGISTSTVRDDFVNFLRRRNQAAHNPAITFTTTDVEQSTRAAFEISLCFDVICTYWVSVATSQGNWARTLAAVQTPQFRFRFVDEGLDGRWRERVSSSVRAYRTFPSEADAIREASRRSVSNRQILIVRDAMQQPRDWRA